jgi:hypothetical protein
MTLHLLPYIVFIIFNSVAGSDFIILQGLRTCPCALVVHQWYEGILYIMYTIQLLLVMFTVDWSTQNTQLLSNDIQLYMYVYLISNSDVLYFESMFMIRW